METKLWGKSNFGNMRPAGVEVSDWGNCNLVSTSSIQFMVSVIQGIYKVFGLNNGLLRSQ
jgi:hypothetical protein